MAKIGLNNFRYGLLTEASDGTPSYGGAKKPAKAISCSVSISNNDAKLYADDALAESDKSFQSGTVTIGIDDEDLATMADLLGHEYDETSGEIVRNANDTAPYVGLGRVVVKMINNVTKYKVEFLNKVKFAEPSQEDNTKGESVEFSTGTIEGTIACLADGDWSKAKTFDTKDEAVAYIEGLLGTSYTIKYDENGGTGSITDVVAKAGSTITLDTGAGLTPPSNKTFAGWATKEDATTPNVESPYLVKASITLYAVWTAQE